MTEQTKFVSDEANQSILQGIHEVIERRIAQLHDGQRAQKITRAIRIAQTEIEQQHARRRYVPFLLQATERAFDKRA